MKLRKRDSYNYLSSIFVFHFRQSDFSPSAFLNITVKFQARTTARKELSYPDRFKYYRTRDASGCAQSPVEVAQSIQQLFDFKCTVKHYTRGNRMSSPRSRPPLITSLLSTTPYHGVHTTGTRASRSGNFSRILMESPP